MNKTTTGTHGTAQWKRNGTIHTAPLGAGLLSEELYESEPIREGNAYPRQRNYHGFYWMAETRRHVWHESLLERDSLLWLDHAADIIAIAAQPMKLIADDGTIHYPDLLALDTRGVQTVYDVKPAAHINAKARAQFEWTRDVCAAVGWEYRVITELPFQYRVNLTWLGQFRQPGFRPGDEAVRELLASLAADWSIDTAVQHLSAESTPVARSQVFHLLWNRTLTCDMHSRLSGRTPIAAATGNRTREEFPRVNA